ncbi:MAG: hypothetical protein QNJ43_17745 [Breoghania sp.]|nr:hypothetical protein [Breoghania sp.]
MFESTGMTPMRRLASLRWLLAAIAVMLAVAVRIHQVPAWHVVAAFVVVVILCAALPQRRAPILSANRKNAGAAAWPGPTPA